MQGDIEGRRSEIIFFNELKKTAESWIISGWKRQRQMKQEVRNVGKFSASTFSIRRQL